MNIVIVGAGVVGSSVAEQLSREGHNISVVDQDRHVVKRLKENLDVLAVQGEGGLPSVLERAGIKSADMVIAVTPGDEVNVVVGMLAGAYAVDHRIVRIRNREYPHEDCVLSLRSLGIHNVVNAEPFIVESLVRMIDLPGAHDYATMVEGQVEMFGFRVAEGSPAIGKRLAELREIGDLSAFLILYIMRKGELIVPRGDATIERGDSVHVLVSPDTVEFLVPIFCPSERRADHVVIVGASRLGVELASALEDRISNLALIAADPEAAREIATRLKKTNVLQGDATDPRILEEASIDKCNLFCAVSDDDERNMLASLVAKKHGAKHTAVLVQQPTYVPILDSLDIEIVINPRLAIAGEILRHVRRGHIFSVTRLAEGQGEIIEMLAPPECAAVSAPLKEVDFPAGSLVGAVVKDGDLVIPTGETRIEIGDTVLVYALPDVIERIEELFAERE